MTIPKWLDLQNCNESVAVGFQCSVKPPCSAIRALNRRGPEYVPGKSSNSYGWNNNEYKKMF